MRRGVKEVVKALRKGEKGLCVIAGDISPLDVICHLPVFCEENDVPYIFVDSKVRPYAHLRAALHVVARACSMRLTL